MSELVNTLPAGVKIVGMVVFREQVILATERGVYAMGAGDTSFAPLVVNGLTYNAEPKGNLSASEGCRHRFVRDHLSMSVKCMDCGAERTETRRT